MDQQVFIEDRVGAESPGRTAAVGVNPLWAAHDRDVRIGKDAGVKVWEAGGF